ncbi:hypothetical protein ACGH7X_06655 [Streptomyces sp. BBFR51]|uniref:hypothetical protein n=1 Tax=Streptomyces sp. BBFR51 TaxID=3372856 RepID=UPI0037DC88DF
MRRRTGAAGIAVAIAAIVPLTDTAHAQELDSPSLTRQPAARAAFDNEPYDPDAPAEGQFAPDGFGDDLLDEGGLTESRPEGGGNDEGGNDGGSFDPGGTDPGGPNEGRPEGNRPGDDQFGQGGRDEGRPDGGRLDQGGNGLGGNGLGGNGPGGNGGGGNGHAREVDGGAAPPRPVSLPTTSSTSVPRPAPTTPVPAPTTATPSPTASAVTPTLGTQGGLGGASGAGPSRSDIGIGLGGVAAATLAAGYALWRRRRA